MNSQYKLKPLLDKIVLIPTEKEKKTESGIVLPEETKDKPNSGKVIAIGNGEKVAKMGLKIGDKVVYEKYGGTEFGGYKIINYDEVFAIIN